MRKSILLFLFFVLVATLSYSQNACNLYTEANFCFGKMIANAGEHSFAPVALGFEVKVGKQTKGENPWESFHKNPRYGLGFRYLSFDSDVLNSKYALFGFIDASFFEYKSFSVNYQVNAGFSYYTNPYDPVTNPDNIWIGSNFNFYVGLNIGINYQLNPHLLLVSVTGFSHSSNATLKQPNLGVNMVTQSVGVRYFLNPPEYAEKSLQFPLEPIENKNTMIATFAPAVKESKRDGAYYFASTLGLAYERRFHHFMTYGLGFDLCYNPSIMSLQSEGHEITQADCFTPAAKASFEVIYGRMSLYAAFAVYLYRAFDFYEPFYERAGIKYYLDKSQRHFVGVFVKAHSGNVDYMEWTYGFRIVEF